MMYKQRLQAKMNQYRVTKYNPTKRNSVGHYQDPNEWTEFSDVGKSVSIEEYTKMEMAYIDTAIDFISNDGVQYLNIVELEDHENKSNLIENASAFPFKSTMF